MHVPPPIGTRATLEIQSGLRVCTPVAYPRWGIQIEVALPRYGGGRRKSTVLPFSGLLSNRARYMG